MACPPNARGCKTAPELSSWRRALPAAHNRNRTTKTPATRTYGPESRDGRLGIQKPGGTAGMLAPVPEHRTRMHELRQEMCMTLDEVADAAGIARNTMRRIEAG